MADETNSEEQRRREELVAKEDELFGKIAVRMGYISQDTLEECLLVQEQMKQTRLVRIGDILVERNYLNTKQVREILSHQSGLLVPCPKCQTPYNVVMFRPDAELICYVCNSKVKVPPRDTTPREDTEIYFAM